MVGRESPIIAGPTRAPTEDQGPRTKGPRTKGPGTRDQGRMGANLAASSNVSLQTEAPRPNPEGADVVCSPYTPGG